MKTFFKIFVSYRLKSELFRGITDTAQTLPVSHMGNHIFCIVDPNFELFFAYVWDEAHFPSMQNSQMFSSIVLLLWHCCKYFIDDKTPGRYSLV